MTPTFEMGGVRLYLADAAEVVSSLDEVDLLATDPPYGVGYDSGFREASPGFGVIHGDRGDVDVRGILARCVARLRNKRHLYVFGPRTKLDGIDEVVCHTDLVWDKGMMGMGDLTKPWGPAHETLTFAVRVMRPAARARGDGRLIARMRHGSVLRHQRPNASSACRHPNEKPVPLMRQIVESSSCSGETVLDPFMGGGATVVAALLEGRRAIGIEIDERYFDVARKRVERLIPLLRQLEDA